MARKYSVSKQYCRVGGQNYQIISGKTSVGGKKYIIWRGGTKTGSQLRDIQFMDDSVLALFEDAQMPKVVGRDDGSQGVPQIAVPLSSEAAKRLPYYIFVTNSSNVGIYKVYVNSSNAAVKVDIIDNSSADLSVAVNTTTNDLLATFSTTGGSSVSATYGGGMVALYFPSYPEYKIDSLLSGLTVYASTGRSSSSSSAVYMNPSNINGKLVLVRIGDRASIAYYSSISGTSATFDQFTSNYSSKPDLLCRYSTTRWYASKDETAQAHYGASITAFSFT